LRVEMLSIDDCFSFSCFFFFRADKRMLIGSEYFTLDPSGPIEGLELKDIPKIYSEFKRFVVAEVLVDDVFKGVGYGQRLSALETELKSAGLSDAAKQAARLQNGIRDEILRDLDDPVHRKNVQEDLVFAIASRALPDRLLLDRTVRIDPQVDVATQIVKNPSKYYSILYKNAESATETALVAENAPRISSGLGE